MNNHICMEEYVCIEIYYATKTTFFAPNLVYSFHESLLKNETYIYPFKACSIPKEKFQNHFILKTNWLREQKINLILNS